MLYISNSNSLVIFSPFRRLMLFVEDRNVFGTVASYFLLTYLAGWLPARHALADHGLSSEIFELLQIKTSVAFYWRTEWFWSCPQVANKGHLYKSPNGLAVSPTCCVARDSTDLANTQTSKKEFGSCVGVHLSKNGSGSTRLYEYFLYNEIV